jgi:hypothetical protein
MSGRDESGHAPGGFPTDTDIAAQVEAFLAQLDQGDPQ